ncbi:MAG: PA14 domain-containing protein [Candidatus Promineifilaceae bacterium]
MQKRIYRVGVLSIAILLLMSLGAMVASSADTDWQANYYNNTTLTGKPVLSNTAAEVDYNWGTNSPGADVNKDNFSARWTKTTTLPAGRYRLTLTSDDGSRAFVNNQLVVNQWWAHALRTASGEYNHKGGELTLRVEFFENLDKAIISFKMEKIADAAPAAATQTPRPASANNTPSNPGPVLNACSTGGWFGNYWNNAFLSGAPFRSQNVGHINYNWGEGAPLRGMNADHWSASWTTTINLAEGHYRFTLTSDDGSTLWVNNWQFINLWYDHTSLTRSRVLHHKGGPITLRIEYYDKEGPANVSFACARIADANPTATPWPTRQATPWPTQPPIRPTTPPATPVPPRPTVTPQPTVDPLLTANEGQCIITNIGALNLRSAPSLSSAIVTTLRQGQVTTRTGNRSGRWVQIRTANNDIGWINEYYCESDRAPRPTAQPTAEANNEAHVCLVEVDALLVRSGPGTSYTYLTVVHRGDPMRLAGQRTADSTWVSVIAPDGTRGWVFAQYIGVPASVLQELTVSNG